VRATRRRCDWSPEKIRLRKVVENQRDTCPIRAARVEAPTRSSRVIGRRGGAQEIIALRKSMKRSWMPPPHSIPPAKAIELLKLNLETASLAILCRACAGNPTPLPGQGHHHECPQTGHSSPHQQDVFDIEWRVNVADLETSREDNPPEIKQPPGLSRTLRGTCQTSHTR